MEDTRTYKGSQTGNDTPPCEDFKKRDLGTKSWVEKLAGETREKLEKNPMERHLEEVMSKTAEIKLKRPEGEYFTSLDEAGQFNFDLAKKLGWKTDVTREFATRDSIVDNLQFKKDLEDLATKHYDNRSDVGKKENKGKLFHELDFGFIKQMSERMAHNKDNNKYPRFNWKKRMEIEELCMASFRHILDVMEGNYEDDGRPYGHLEALATNAMMINFQVKNFSDEEKEAVE